MIDPYLYFHDLARMRQVNPGETVKTSLILPVELWTSLCMESALLHAPKAVFIRLAIQDLVRRCRAQRQELMRDHVIEMVKHEIAHEHLRHLDDTDA
jgi:acyl-CoA hydrolase